MAGETRQRLGYVDWMRGLACLLMFQTHCYDAWLTEEARRGAFFGWSQLIGTLPAPLFLFLAGISFALVTEKLRARGLPPNEIARTTLARGAEIFGIALLFRIQQFAFGWPWAPWSDLLRVDILNTMGLSMMLMALVCRAAKTRAQSAWLATGAALAIAMAAPPMWTTWRSVTSRLPWPLESYLNGVHTLGAPQPWLFPLFPWAALAFAGLAAGFVMFSDRARARPSVAMLALGACGVGLYFISNWLDSLPVQIYAVYDYWHTSPNFFLARAGVLLVILFLCYAWCRWGAGERGFSPMMKLGQASLLVYWVHIELVYGRFSILPHRGASVTRASRGLAAIFAAMVALAWLRLWWKDRRRRTAAAATN
jgi:uncharacterized membrane protein